MISSYLMYFPNIIYQYSLKHVALSSNSSISALHLLNVNFRKVLVMMNLTLSSQRLSKLQEDCLPQMMNRLARNISLQNLNTFLLILLNQYAFLLILRLIAREIIFWIPLRLSESILIISFLFYPCIISLSVFCPSFPTCNYFPCSLRDLESSSSSDDAVVHSTTDSPESPSAPPPITTDPIVILPRLSSNSLVSIVLFSLQLYLLLFQSIQV